MIHCTKCFEVQPDNNKHFSINKKNKRGLSSQCKGCTQDYKKRIQEEKHRYSQGEEKGTLCKRKGRSEGSK